MDDLIVGARTWDAAVKRPFSLAKMLAALQNKAEAGVAKRLRMAGALNRNGRLLYFYGLGICVAANNDAHDEYKFEAVLLSQYQPDFSSYTLKRFMDDYTRVPPPPPSEAGEGEAEEMEAEAAEEARAEARRIERLQSTFSIIKMKVLLGSLLDGFRYAHMAITLMGRYTLGADHSWLTSHSRYGIHAGTSR